MISKYIQMWLNDNDLGVNEEFKMQAKKNGR